MKKFLQIILKPLAIILITGSMLTSLILSIKNWEYSHMYIFINYWKITIPSILSLFLGIFLIYYSEQ